MHKLYRDGSMRRWLLKDGEVQPCVWDLREAQSLTRVMLLPKGTWTS